MFLSSPAETSILPSHEKLTLRILELWALVSVTCFPSSTNYHNLIAPSAAADAITEPLGWNLRY